MSTVTPTPPHRLLFSRTYPEKPVQSIPPPTAKVRFAGRCVCGGFERTVETTYAALQTPSKVRADVRAAYFGHLRGRGSDNES